MKNPVSTISGIALLIISALAFLGIITQEESINLGQYVEAIITAIGGIISLIKSRDAAASLSNI